jgi:fibronectin-binding autotransporter adhesin
MTSPSSFELHRISRGVRVIAMILGCVVCCPLAYGATVTWDGSTDMTWTQPDSTSWSGATYNSGDTALFDGAGTGTVTITGTVTPGQINVTSGSYTLSGVIGGTASVNQSGTGVLTLAGSGANTYTGTTTVSAGQLILNKTTGITAIAGDLTITGAAVTFGANNQIADTAAVTMSGASSYFNGTSGVVASPQSLDETIGSLDVSGGVFLAGGVGSTTGFTVTGAASFTGGVGNTSYIQNSAGLASFGSLSLVGLTSDDFSTATPVANRFFVFGNNAQQTVVTVGSGGLSLDGSNVLLNNGNAGSRLVLNGDVTTIGSATSAILAATGTGTINPVWLSGTSGSVTRTFTIGGGGANLTVSAPITNGSATTAGIRKLGAGTLTLSRSNSYDGGTQIDAGVLALGNANALGTTGTISFGGGTLQFSASNTADYSSRFSTAASQAYSLDTNGRDVSLATALTSSGGSLTKLGAGTLTLSGNNSYSGNTTISAGRLALNGSGVLGSGSYAGTIANAGELVVDSDAAQILSGAISGTGTVTKSGAGTLTLSTGNSYTGGTTLNAGVLSFASDGLGTAGAVTLNGGTLQWASGNTQDISSRLTLVSGSTATLDTNGNNVTLAADFGGSTTAVLTKLGSGTLTLSGTNTYTGGTQVDAGTLQIGDGGTTGSIVGNTAVSAGATLAFHRSNNSTYSGVVSGAGGLAQLGSGTLTLSGGAANTFTGTTTVSAGVLTLAKTAGVNAVAGNLVINNAIVTFGTNNQIGDTAAVTMSGSSSVFNGASYNGGAAGNLNLDQTISSLTVSGGIFFPGGSGQTTGFTVTGAASFTGGAGNTQYLQNSGGLASFGSLSLVGMNSTAEIGPTATPNQFALTGNSTARQTTLTVGSGGLWLDGSNLNLSLGSSPGMLGSRIVLNGDVSTTGGSASSIFAGGGGGVQDGRRAVELSSTAGSHVRTFTVADVTSSAATDLTVGVPITNGVATSGGITKAGPGTLLLSAANTFTGPTSVSAGTLAVGGANAVAGSSGLSIAAGATLDLSALGSGLTLGSGQSLGGAGSIQGSLLFGSGSSLVFSTTDTLTLSAGTASFFSGTPGSRFGIDDLLGLTSGTPLATYTLISGTVDFTNLDNVGAGDAYDLGDGVSAYFQQGSLQVVVVPEPAGVAVWGLGLVVVGVAARRWRR